MSNWMKTFMGGQVAAPYITTMQNLLGSILFTLVVASFMLVIYRVCHDTLTYNKKFNITLMMLAVISTVLLALIQNNPLLSLGVLGSLSICRIRTNTKDPRDLGFVFWAGVTVQSKNVFTDTFELVYELQLEKNEEEKLVSRISNIEGIRGVNVLAPKTKVA